MQISSERISALFERFPLLKPTIKILNASGIPFAIGGSGCLYVLGNERLPDDVDIYLPDDMHDEADRLFNCKSYQYQSKTENVRNSNPEGNHSIQLTSGLSLNVGGKQYDLSLTSDVMAMRLGAGHEGERVYFYPPEDVLLIKALLQRSQDVGKHDIEDIENFLKIYPDLRLEYLKSRIRSLGAEERTKGIFTA